MRILHVFDSSVEHQEEAWREKFENVLKNLILLWFRVLKMHISARNGQTRSKIDEVKAGP